MRGGEQWGDSSMKSSLWTLTLVAAAFAQCCLAAPRQSPASVTPVTTGQMGVCSAGEDCAHPAVIALTSRVMPPAGARVNAMGAAFATGAAMAGAPAAQGPATPPIGDAATLSSGAVLAPAQAGQKASKVSTAPINPAQANPDDSPGGGNVAALVFAALGVMALLASRRGQN